VVPNPPDHASAVGTFPNEVANEDEEVVLVGTEFVVQSFHRVGTPVYVTDDVDSVPGAGIDAAVPWFDRLVEETLWRRHRSTGVYTPPVV
jgi:hypothetical protein